MRRDTAVVLAGYMAFMALVFWACGTQGPNNPSSFATPIPIGPKPVPVGPAPRPVGPSGGPGPSSDPSGAPGPGATPTPSGSPADNYLVVSGLSSAGSVPYTLTKFEGSCCGVLSNGPSWVDYPYGLNLNLSASVGTPVWRIAPAVADTADASDPMITFSMNKCATVMVFFADPGGTAGCPPGDPYPSWILSEGWQCSVNSCLGTPFTFDHESGSGSIQGPMCRKNLLAGSVSLGPREPVAVNAKMYTVFVRVPATTCP